MTHTNYIVRFVPASNYIFKGEMEKVGDDWLRGEYEAVSRNNGCLEVYPSLDVAVEEMTSMCDLATLLKRKYGADIHGVLRVFKRVVDVETREEVASFVMKEKKVG